MPSIHDTRKILSEIRYRDWRFLAETDKAGPFLVLEFDEPCNVTGAPAVQRSRKWKLSQHMTRSEVVQTALKALLTALEHEAREQFTYRGRAIFGPHFDVDALHMLCIAGNQDVRPVHGAI